MRTGAKISIQALVGCGPHHDLVDLLLPKAIAELKVGQGVKIPAKTRDEIVVKLTRGLGREFGLGNQRVLVAHGLL